MPALEIGIKQQTVPLIVYILAIWMNHFIVLRRNINMYRKHWSIPKFLLDWEYFLQYSQLYMKCIALVLFILPQNPSLCVCICNAIKFFTFSTKLFDRCFPLIVMCGIKVQMLAKTICACTWFGNTRSMGCFAWMNFEFLCALLLLFHMDQPCHGGLLASICSKN